MNNILKEFLIIAILVIAFLYILQMKKNEHLDATENNITAKNITATGMITFPGAKQSVKQGDGLTVFNDPGFGGANWIRGDRNYISGSANIGKDLTVDGTITANKIISKDGSSSGPLSNEAIQNIASVYNKDNFTVTNVYATGSINAPAIRGSLVSPNGTRQLRIDNDGFITVTDGNGTPIRASIRMGELWSPKSDYYITASNVSDKGVVQGYYTNGVKASYAEGTK